MIQNWIGIQRALQMHQLRHGLDPTDAHGRMRAWERLDEDARGAREETIRRIRCVTRHPADHVSGSDAVKLLETFALELEAELPPEAE